ncbi:purine-binding chemotaxis protein CheW [Marinospirillum celere]|uniref:Purine-binding chemotaxis protein CheW n=1 Tax=Marinospirillum celere TaxID=1122252 RepID=A0A1I1H4Y0_9GAMM|nr:chemotaxis protein CheW [Marinospirillum celere]SFC17118.1 purine-binding chemotaxis protein CheW [Marinospirillum celere]
MSWHETPQQAIEGYLEALLRDDGQDFEDEALEQDTERAPARREESFQGRHLSDSMARAKQLAEPEVAAPKTQLDEAEPTPQVLMPELKFAPPEPEVEPEPEPVATPEPVAKPKPAEPEVAKPVPPAPAPPKEDQVPDQPPSPPGWKNGRPVWAQERFECLLFKVKGLTLAVPLVELGGIIKIDREPTPLFGQPDWFMGMLRANDMNVCMVDTAQWVLPSALIEKHPEPYQLIIRIHDSVWGLACNEVDRSISLEPDQVRWRTSLGKRPWLAGTVIEHMCALIDVAAFDRLLKEGHGQMEPANLSALKQLDTE